MLQARVLTTHGGAVRVSIYAPIWIVNKTGLPLIFKQEGSSEIAAGQDEEHEVNQRFSHTLARPSGSMTFTASSFN